ncbi:MAG: hypothetical protein ACN6RH_00200 [Stenotrophomonas rhizophila]|uniref:hypothetical protein n=1 Tax=Stenotrophomonas rhizophila TaxID=216778 RepID=UPI003D0CE0CA
MSSNFGTPNSSEQHQNLNVNRCIEDDGGNGKSAIDFFEIHLKQLIRFSAQHQREREVIRLALLGLVSLTENYFRIILSDILRLCPASHDLCAKMDVKFSSAHYYSASAISRSLVDGCVFSNSVTISEETKRLTGLNVLDSVSVKNALGEFHKVCILRHAAVHSFGRLGGKNATELGLRQTVNVMVAPSYEAFDEICGICQNLVRSYNSFMWKACIARLGAKGYLKFDDSSTDRAFFREMQAVFWEDARLEEDAGGIYRELSAPLIEAAAV